MRSVHVGRLRDAGFEVFRTSDTHANIRYLGGVNLPLRSEDETAARNVATRLLEVTKMISYWDSENADATFTEEHAQRG